MRSAIIALLVILQSLVISGQTLVIKDCNYVPLDLTASTYPRKDNNGNFCALLKIEAPVLDLLIQGNVVGPVERKASEYWCYLTEGTNKLKILSNQSESVFVDFKTFGISGLGAKRTYIIKVANLSSQGASSSQSGNLVETFTVNGVSFDMVRVDGGSFQMGSDDGADFEKPVHTENVATFYIGKTEVTQALWKAVMGDNPSRFIRDNNPVEQVSWYDCQEFVERLSRITGKTFRLPTEVEWEYAAKGGSKSRGYKYSGSNDINQVAWYARNSGDQTHPVAQKLDNELGIYDMTGNVWEWCSDRSSSNYSSPRDSSNRVYRGGSWSDSAICCRVAYRCYFSPSHRSPNLGLRLALTL